MKFTHAEFQRLVRENKQRSADEIDAELKRLKAHDKEIHKEIARLETELLEQREFERLSKKRQK